MTSPDQDGPGPSRRTLLAAERTWLAWWRTGIAAATAAVGVGGLVPNLVEGSRWPYELLGAGYALVAVGVFAFAVVRQQRIDAALRRGEQPSMDLSWVIALTLAGGVLALATLAVVVVQP
jgi:putative membrane protein